jgi:hypothetical protein
MKIGVGKPVARRKTYPRASPEAGSRCDFPSYMLAVNQGQSAWPFGSKRFTAVPQTGIDGSSPAIPRSVGYLLGMSPTFPQAVRPPTLRSELFSSRLAMGQRSKNCCALLERWFRTRACCRASSAGLRVAWGSMPSAGYRSLSRNWSTCFVNSNSSASMSHDCAILNRTVRSSPVLAFSASSLHSAAWRR